MPPAPSKVSVELVNNTPRSPIWIAFATCLLLVFSAGAAQARPFADDGFGATASVYAHVYAAIDIDGPASAHAEIDETIEAEAGLHVPPVPRPATPALPDVSAPQKPDADKPEADAPQRPDKPALPQKPDVTKPGMPPQEPERPEKPAPEAPETPETPDYAAEIRDLLFPNGTYEENETAYNFSEYGEAVQRMQEACEQDRYCGLTELCMKLRELVDNEWWQPCRFLDDDFEEDEEDALVYIRAELGVTAGPDGVSVETHAEVRAGDASS